MGLRGFGDFSGCVGRGCQRRKAYQESDKKDCRPREVGIIKIPIECHSGPDRTDDPSQAHRGIAQSHRDTLPEARAPGGEGKDRGPQEGFREDEETGRQQDGHVGVGCQEHQKPDRSGQQGSFNHGGISPTDGQRAGENFPQSRNQSDDGENRSHFRRTELKFFQCVQAEDRLEVRQAEACQERQE